MFEIDNQKDASTLKKETAEAKSCSPCIEGCVRRRSLCSHENLFYLCNAQTKTDFVSFVPIISIRAEEQPDENIAHLMSRICLKYFFKIQTIK